MWFLFQAIVISVSWSNTQIIVPVGSDLSDYINLPYAELYQEEKLVSDPYMYIEYETNYTSFATVSTNNLGTYRVDYTIYFPTYFFESTESIYFIVSDINAPVINVNEQIVLNVKQTKPNYLSYITYSDNFDSYNDLTVSINDAFVDLNNVGEYNLYVEVKDKSGNVAKKTLKVSVVDVDPPVVTQSKEAQIVYGDIFDYTKFFNITDNYSKVFTVSLNKNIQSLGVGTYEVILTVKDQAGNTKNTNFDLTILSPSGPKIELMISSLTINYKQELTPNELSGYIASVTCVFDSVTKDDVFIESKVFSNYLGTYEVLYKVYDMYNTLGQTALIVYVKDTEKPDIQMTSTLEFEVKSREPIITELLTITDNYDDYDSLTITSTGKIDMNKIGVYRINVTVKDTSKNEATITLDIEIIDNIAPTITGNKEIRITDFKEPLFKSLFTITDNYDPNPTFSIDTSGINFLVIGSHQVNIIAKDQSNNETIEQINIIIEDVISPKIVLLVNQVTINYSNNEINYLDYVNEVYDLYDTKLGILDLRITGSVDTTTLGTYRITYTVKDSSDNETSEELIIKIVDKTPPVITASNITVKKNEIVNLNAMASAFDDYDKDISQYIMVNPSYIPFHIPGIYEITFYVNDSSGNYASQKVSLTIVDEDTFNLNYILIIAGGLLLGGFGLNYYMKKKKQTF